MGNTDQRVVITGMAASTCCGIGKEHFYKRLEKGLHSSANEESESKIHRYAFTSITHDISKLLRRTRTDNLLTQHLLAAVDNDLGSQISRLDEGTRTRAGVSIGNSSGNFRPYYEYYTTATQEGHELVNPVHFPATLLNYSTVTLNQAFSLKGSSSTISSGFSAGLDAIGYAALRIKHGEEQIIFAGGIEEINDCNSGFLEHKELLSDSGKILPFRPGRDGALPGEGVGILMLEPAAGADQASKRIFGEILGYGSTKGNSGEKDLLLKAVSAIERSLNQANIGTEDIDAIFPSANGTISGDEFEAKVLKRVFGSRLAKIPLYPIKSITGECFTASGPLQCIAALHALTQNDSPDLSGAKKTTPVVDGLVLLERIMPCRKALVYSFGLDNTFSALVLGKV